MAKNSIDSPTQMPAKRKKTDDEDSAFNKKRSRVSFSCGECHRRKQKCDRQVPCSHCVARKVPELCKAYTPGRAEQDMGARLARLEHIIELALPQFCGMNESASWERPRATDSVRQSSDDDSRSQPDEGDPSGGSFQSGRWYGNSASGSIAPGSIIEQLQHAVPGSTPQDTPYSRDSNLRSLTSPTSVDSVSETTAADNLKNLVDDCGVSPTKVAEIFLEQPTLRIAQVLIDYYFQAINWTRYPISESDFRASYNAIHTHREHGMATTNPQDVCFLPLLFVVLAIAVRLAPEDIGGDARHRRVTSLRYYWSSRRALLIAAAIQPDSLDIVLTRLLSARFLTFDRRITECWSQLGAAVRTAQALGLHRDGSSMGLEPSLAEYRRRIWSYLYHADRSYALVLGRPNSIQDDYTSTRHPLNMDSISGIVVPMTTPTKTTFIILRHQLATIMGSIVHHFQQVKPSHYKVVQDLDDSLCAFVRGLPPHFAIHPDTSLDEECPYIPVHRYLLITEIMFVRTSLHRPYLLQRLSSDRYARSRAACFESVMMDFQTRQAFRETMARDKRESLSNAYREFQTAMISGIYLVLEPEGEHAETMLTILESFVKEHEGIREMDDTTRRELKTIEFLKEKATRPVESNPAQLLLGLQQQPQRTQSSAFPSMLNPIASPRSPFAGMSPTMARLQANNGGEFGDSPTGSGSPSADEDSAAQSMLDQWCAPMDASGVLPGWGIGSAGPGSAAWYNGAGSSTGAQNSQLMSLDGSSTWDYWETLVNQIRPMNGTTDAP
ncbi:hypothetical protein CYLTODRAFT_484889 [Cylindrobasidium torrendii FP15055 ss-10]|uniref:Zn(2)-C6 fungal-type domain-containing protein n=1 Tax=Cylindrobasidium torrendii FP15055 ss-10 TaxID=1314674 RepID=A0A0D7BVC5_9AGAR|nr:hypothetical protein CYLTODRAFT_484889 [Cylindrobasidium torrendii FP15055 ss-10]